MENQNSTDSFQVNLDQFNGPLDLLLDLAKSQKVNLEDISITKLADQFHEFITNNKNISLSKELEEELNTETNKNNIQIEERSSTEISHIKSLENNEVKNIRIFPKEVKTYNPAFDVTPSKMITSLITEHVLCIAKRSEIVKILKKQKI